MNILNIFYLHSIDKELLQTVNNHPVHILNEKGNFSPSSFIPFCYFGEDFIGARIQEFEIPVCNIFRPRIYFDQLCYETDLQDLKDNNSENFLKQLELGLTLVIDYNEERQLDSLVSESVTNMSKTKYNLNNENSLSMYLDTISNQN